MGEDRPMNKRLILLAVATSLTTVVAGAAGREYQRWVDEKGVVHYGDAPPPEATKNPRAVLNDQGVVVREYPKQMTPDEAAAAQQALENAARRKAQDSFLLTTYTKVDDIERARNDQLALIDSHIELARGSLSSSDQKLESLRNRMSSFKPYSSSANARRLPDALAGEAVQALSERRSMEETLARHEARKQEVRAKFDADITRYRELVSRPSIR
jgi:hypothetical protein